MLGLIHGMSHRNSKNIGKWTGKDAKGKEGKGREEKGFITAQKKE